MSTRKLFFPMLLLCAGLALILRVFVRRAAAKPATDSTAFAGIDAYVEQKMRRLKMPGVALAIVEGDKIAYQRGFGEARPGSEAPSPHTLFFIGSLTKSFTALAVMQLVEAGQVDLDAPVQRYLPWFRVADSQLSAAITLRHLLNQTSGLPTRVGEIQLANFDSRPGATERQARELSTVALKHPIGSTWEYSNANYNLLGLIIETVSHESYAAYLQAHILNPLGMSHTYTVETVNEHDLAMGHRYWFAVPYSAPNLPLPHGSLPAGMLVSCTEDIAHYLSMLLNGGRYGQAQLLSRAGIEELQRGAADVGVMGRSLGQYGMGWFVSAMGKTKLVWHSGTLPHFAAYMALLPAQNKGVVLLFNADHHWMNPVLTEFGAGVTALLAGEPPAGLPLVGIIPWMLRGQLLIPVLQAIGVMATLRLLRRWGSDPEYRQNCERKWWMHILLPLMINLGVAIFALKPMLGKTRGYLMQYMPDFSWIALICGSFAVVWSFLRTALILRAPPHPLQWNVCGALWSPARRQQL